MWLASWRHQALACNPVAASAAAAAGGSARPKKRSGISASLAGGYQREASSNGAGIKRSESWQCSPLKAKIKEKRMAKTIENYFITWLRRLWLPGINAQKPEILFKLKATSAWYAAGVSCSSSPALNEE